jgi:WD40 repeat protein
MKSSYSTNHSLRENFGKPLQTLEGHSNSVRAVAFSPDGKHLASGSGNSKNIFGILSSVVKDFPTRVAAKGMMQYRGTVSLH